MSSGGDALNHLGGMLPFDTLKWWSGVAETYPDQSGNIMGLCNFYMIYGKKIFLMEFYKHSYNSSSSRQSEVFELIYWAIFDALYGWQIDEIIYNIIDEREH